MNIAEFSNEDLLQIVSNLLETMIDTNNKIPNSQLTYFHSKSVPNISILSYLTRISKFTPFTNESLISILIYFDRISKLNHLFTINSYNIHRLLITSVVVASKFTSDVYYTNNRYAKVGGIPLKELNQLELEFLFLVDFQLYIPLDNFQEYADQLFIHGMPLLPNYKLSTPSPSLSPSSSTEITSHSTSLSTIHKKSKVKLYHPYQRPSNNRKRLGLVSPTRN